jgi:hypothetical protein
MYQVLMGVLHVAYGNPAVPCPVHACDFAGSPVDVADTCCCVCCLAGLHVCCRGATCLVIGYGGSMLFLNMKMPGYLR